MDIHQQARDQGFYTIRGFAEELNLKNYQIHNAIKMLNIPTEYIDTTGNISQAKEGLKSKIFTIISEKYIPTVRSYYKMEKTQEPMGLSMHDYRHYPEIESDNISWNHILVSCVFVAVGIIALVWVMLELIWG